MKARFLCFWIQLFLIGLAGLLEVFAQVDVPTIDFLPREGWKTKGSVSVNGEGRICLTQDGEGLVWKSLELDVDEFPLILIRVGNSLPRERWKVVVEKSDAPTFDKTQEICLVNKLAEEGGFIIPFRELTKWSGKLRFVVMVVIEGRKGDRIVLETLEAVHMSGRIPAAPKLASPANKSAISSDAPHFAWYRAEDAVEYELQVSGHSDFSEGSSFRMPPPYLTDKLLFLPEDRAFCLQGSGSGGSADSISKVKRATGQKQVRFQSGR